MLKTLDILIGGVTVLLLFSMAVTVLTQTFTTILAKRGTLLLSGLANLLQQLGISDRKVAEEISTAVLKHPAVASIKGDLATVVHRHEFTKLLLDLGSDQPLVQLSADASTALKAMLTQNGVKNPAQTLKSIRAMSMMLEASNPDMASYARQDLAILKESASDYVAKINSWFDQTIDRVSQAFAKHAHVVTLVVSFIVVFAVQLDIVAVIDRLSIDDQFRQAVVGTASKTMADYTQSSATGNYNLDPQHYYDLLNSAGLVTLPTSSNWLKQLGEPRKYPGMIIAVLLLSLGAAFWYNILKDLLGLRSALAQNDDAQRQERQTTQTATPGAATPGATTASSSTAPALAVGERGDVNATG